MLPNTSTKPEISVKMLDNSSRGIRRRANSKKLKEKRREDSFVNKYIQLKYPEIYSEIKVSYNMFAEKYPSRCDLTKTYFFQKWKKQINMEQSKLYVPHLPILSKTKHLSKTRHGETTSSQPSPQSEHVSETSAPQPSPQSEHVSETSAPQQSPQSEHVSETSAPQPSPQSEHVSETSAPQPSPQSEHVSETSAPQPSPQSEHVSETSAPQQSPQPQLEDPCMGMTLDEMTIAAEEIIRSLQSDRDLMDIVENFEFPEPTWNNDLVITDYVLETDEDW